MSRGWDSCRGGTTRTLIRRDEIPGPCGGPEERYWPSRPVDLAVDVQGGAGPEPDAASNQPALGRWTGANEHLSSRSWWRAKEET